MWEAKLAGFEGKAKVEPLLALLPLLWKRAS